MQCTRHRREGFALAVAIAAIVVIGALIAGVFFASTQQFRIGRNTLLQARAVTAAEYGVSALLDPTQPDDKKWKPAWNNAAVGIKDTIVFASNGAVDTVQVTKLNTTNFFVSSKAHVGSASGAQAERGVGTLLTLNIPKINVRGALTVRGGLKDGGSSEINGNDTPIPGWDCPPADTALPGIAVPDASDINCTGCQGDVIGNPAIREDPVADQDSTYFKFGDTDWEMLAAMGKIPAGGAPAPSTKADGSCDTSDPDNWGDPESWLASGACDTYFPIIHVPGDLTLSGGIGQGMLLVDGDLQVTGQFTFYGPIIVKGKFSNTGNATIYGGLMAANVNFGESKFSGNAVIKYSSCAMSKAINGAAQPLQARLRPWVELF